MNTSRVTVAAPSTKGSKLTAVFAASMGYVDCDPLLSVISTDPMTCKNVLEAEMGFEDEKYCDEICDGGEVCHAPNGAPLWATEPHTIDLDIVLRGLPEGEQAIVLDSLEEEGYAIV